AQKQPTSNQQQAKTISRSPSRIPVPEVVASVFPTFCSLLGSLTSSAQSKLKPPALIMKLIDNIYDARLRYEQQNEIMKQKLRTYPQKHLEQDHFHGDDKLDPFTSFPAFVYHHFKQLHGVNSIVTQNCWDLMCNIISLRKSVNTPLSIEIFAQFLSEQRSIDHLAFFVRTREAVLNILAKYGVISELPSPSKRNRSPLMKHHGKGSIIIDIPHKYLEFIAKNIFSQRLALILLDNIHERVKEPDDVELNIFLYECLGVFQECKILLDTTPKTELRKPYHPSQPMHSHERIPPSVSEKPPSQRPMYRQPEGEKSSDYSSRKYASDVISLADIPLVGQGKVREDLPRALSPSGPDGMGHGSRSEHYDQDHLSVSTDGFVEDPSGELTEEQARLGEEALLSQLHKTLRNLMEKYIDILLYVDGPSLPDDQMEYIRSKVKEQLELSLQQVASSVFKDVDEEEYIPTTPEDVPGLSEEARLKQRDYKEVLRKDLLDLTKNSYFMSSSDRERKVDYFCRALLGSPSLREQVETTAAMLLTRSLRDVVMPNEKLDPPQAHTQPIEDPNCSFVGGREEKVKTEE
ncbi:hypothetical protein ADUPG1_012192, partial [Aduncisulcus paluster]